MSTETKPSTASESKEMAGKWIYFARNLKSQCFWYFVSWNFNISFNFDRYTGEEKENEVTKLTYRKKIWEYLDKNNLANFPQPVYGRIPNFKGNEEAAKKLLELPEFENVKYVEVNPDKAQESARILMLEQGKNLYVPVPRLKEGLLKYITVPENSTKNDIKKAVNRRGLEYNGKTIGVKDEVKIDLLVLGSVAVSKEGYRIGKGRGYADLEFGILLEMGAVNEKTLVVTTVHDSQVSCFWFREEDR